MTVGRLAAALGKGLVAGLAGTAAMTISSTAEMKLRKRPASSTPAKVAGKVLGVQPVGEAEKARFSNLAHWGYGVTWGLARGLLDAAGLKGKSGTLAHLTLVWGTELIMLPALKVSPPVTEWGAKEVAIDLLHHSVYATATGLAYEELDREDRGQTPAGSN